MLIVTTRLPISNYSPFLPFFFSGRGYFRPKYIHLKSVMAPKNKCFCSFKKIKFQLSTADLSGRPYWKKVSCPTKMNFSRDSPLSPLSSRTMLNSLLKCLQQKGVTFLLGCPRPDLAWHGLHGVPS